MRIKKTKKGKTAQAAKRSLHQLRKRRHIGPKCRASPPQRMKKQRKEYYAGSENHYSLPREDVQAGNYEQEMARNKDVLRR